MLEPAQWNAPTENFYNILSDGRRAWIVRDTVAESDRNAPCRPHPALISSRGIEKLCGWIEEVAATMRCNPHGRRALRLLLGAVTSVDSRAILRQLTAEAERFLNTFDDSLA